jgi:hypothetical protein
MVFNEGTRLTDKDWWKGRGPSAGVVFMDPVLSQTVPTLAVSVIYCLWRWAHNYQVRRERQLRQRVAYMLWMAATEAD